MSEGSHKKARGTIINPDGPQPDSLCESAYSPRNGKKMNWIEADTKKIDAQILLSLVFLSLAANRTTEIKTLKITIKGRNENILNAISVNMFI
ncbi:MAG: hypothetical protein AB3N14_21415 [Flavobacteriaceae bacterium]